MAGITRDEPMAVLELRMAARFTGVDDDSTVQVAEALSADLGQDLGQVADVLIDRLLAGVGLEDAIATFLL